MHQGLSYTVCTLCFTYNQESYILDTLRGFVIQKTSFPVVSIIVDDASTDRTPHLLRDYLNKHFNVQDTDVAYQEEADYGTVFFAQHRTNKNCYFVVLLLKENHYSRGKSKIPYMRRWTEDVQYYAICEGDDYWTDPLKLQKQVEFMDCHPEIGLCYTDYNHLDQASHVLTTSMFEEQNGYRTASYERFLLKPGYLAPMTWLYRSELSDLIKNSTVYSDGTYAYMLEFMQNSQVSYLPFVTATYRSHAGSASSPTNVKSSWSFLKGVFDTQLYYSQKYPCSEDLQRRVKIQGYLRWLPVAIMADQHVFVEEARDFFESQDMDISLIISELEEGEKRKRSYAYRIGKKLMSPFSFLRRRFG
jgi:glycosyltransferase involved in cell wall biosynthesis